VCVKYSKLLLSAKSAKSPTLVLTDGKCLLEFDRIARVWQALVGGHDFLLLFSWPWSRRGRYGQFSCTKVLATSPEVHLQFHIQSYATLLLRRYLRGRRHARASPTAPGLLYERESVEWPTELSSKPTSMRIEESRRAIALRCMLGGHSTPRGGFALVMVSDHRFSFGNGNGEYRYKEEIDFDSFGLSIATALMGLSVFQYCICLMTRDWELEWTDTLSYFEDMSGLQVCPPLYPLEVPDSQRDYLGCFANLHASSTSGTWLMAASFNNTCMMIRTCNSLNRTSPSFKYFEYFQNWFPMM